MEINKIFFGDCLIGMKKLADNSIDAVVTDPPYGWKFMGKKWDYEIPSVAIWEEVYRVLKPGAHILAACGTRTQHRMALNIEDAGFEIRDVICWHYGSGFPKSLDIGKAIDKMGEENKKYSELSASLCNYLKIGREQKGLSQKEVAANFPSRTGGLTGCVWNWENGLNTPTIDQWRILKEFLSLENDEYNDLIERAIVKRIEAERDIIGYKKRGFIPDGNKVYGKFSGDNSITTASTEEAKKWDGWGTALKPATEFWTLARKPISEKTVAANILRWGVGGLNIDACKIGEGITRQGRENNTSWGIDRIGKKNNIRGNKAVEDTTVGRFPANLILDDFMAEEMDLQSGILKSGGASRFFYVAKPSAEERGDTSHVTVKPQTLIQYLIKLICPIEPGRTVLEPFAGSGSHCIAARKLGLDFIASEIDELSCREANERLTKEMGLFI